MNDLSLYVHIPFCIRKCNYCAFFSLAGQKDSLKSDYTNALIKQINALETDKEICSIYIGGGTPPVLGTDNLCRVLSALTGRFDISPDCEITVEVNPGSVDGNSISALHSAGVNRFSVGVQSLDDGELALAGRVHSALQALGTIESIASSGIDNISADLIFGLPSQTTASFDRSLEKLLESGVKHISAYSLQHEANTAFAKLGDALTYPSEDEEEEMYALLCSRTANAGFAHYEVSSFASGAKFYSRHNCRYWSRGEYFGFGAGAHSFYLGRRFFAPDDIVAFINSAGISAFAPTNYESAPELSPDEAYEESVMLGLRTIFGIPAKTVQSEKAEKFVRLGLAKLENGVFSLTDKGFRLSNAVISEILT